MKQLVMTLLLLTLVSLTFTGCKQQQETANQVRVGVIAGPGTQLMEAAKQVALKKYGLQMTIIPFGDYSMPNQALSDGSIDANMFQDIPFLKMQIKQHHYKIIAIGKTFIYPMAIYSKKIKKLSELKDGAVVAIPNDPSNEARALLLLQQAGLIQLKKGAGVNAMLVDITSNPKKLKIKTLGAAQLPRVLPDVTLAIINTNYAIPAGLLPSRDGLFVEDATHSKYANIVVIRKDEKGQKKFKELVEALHSKAVLQAAKKLFKGQAIPAWGGDNVVKD